MKFCACGAYFPGRRDAPDLRNLEARSDHFHRFSRYNIQVQQGTGRLFDGLRHGFRGEDRAAGDALCEQSPLLGKEGTG